MGLQFHYNEYQNGHPNHYYCIRLDLRDPESLTHFNNLAIAFKEACIAEVHFSISVLDLFQKYPQLLALRKRVTTN
jgi:hypothetical protein